MSYLVLGLAIILGYVAVITVRKTRARRWALTAYDAPAYGMVPRDRLDPGRAGPPPPRHLRQERQAIADAAWAGNWKPAAAYVEAAGQDWDERWLRFELLDSVARRDEGWLRAWRAAEPGSCDAAALEAHRMVRAAWAVRGSGQADEVPEADMRAFRAMLPAAIEAARRAARLDPANPAPWVVMVAAARGARYTPKQFRELWRGLVERAPYHYEGHWQGMQYWCAKWLGSDKKMLAFARRAIKVAPAGSPLPGLYLHALGELERRGTLGATLGGELGRQPVRKVAAALARVPPNDERLTLLRHLLAYYAGRAELYRIALEQFRAIGPWCGCQPWTNAADPVAAFDSARGTAVRLSRAKPLPPELRPKAARQH
ncbi:hypothetical protein ACIRD3_25410 [Kitasatospora sp. NPDC093550]|uniref:hypothetical protein n=1 Tax=Kitasatospora sp. NPDC093550 TaxID=3364089 RepID=UPI00380F5687